MANKYNRRYERELCCVKCNIVERFHFTIETVFLVDFQPMDDKLLGK